MGSHHDHSAAANPLLMREPFSLSSRPSSRRGREGQGQQFGDLAARLVG